MMRLLFTVCVVLCLGVSSLQAQEKFLGKTADGWAGQLKTGADAKQRRSAAFALGKMGSRASTAVVALKNAYGVEKDAKVREAIVFSLGEICREVKGFYDYRETPANVKDSLRASYPEICLGGAAENHDIEKLLLSAVADNDAPLRRSAAFALGCLASQSEATRKALETALADSEPMVRQNAAYAMAQFAESALPELKKALTDTDSLVKRDAASVLGMMRDGDKVHELLPELLPLCKDANSEVRRAALNVLMKIVDPGDKNAINDLRWALDDRDTENKRNAAFALSRIGGPESAIAVPILLEAAKTGDVDMRRQMLRALRNIGPHASEAVNELVGYLRKDSDPEVRISVALALGGIGAAAEAAMPALVEKIGDAKEQREVRMECAMALSRMGSSPASRAIAPKLLDMISDTRHDGFVREKIWWALKIHGGDLNKMKGTFEAFSSVCKEQPNVENRMLRYDCAYLLGMIWQSNAPDQTLDVLHDFLKDETIKVFDKVVVKVGDIKTVEGKEGAKGKVELVGKGDGRVMAADALKMMGPARYAQRADIMKQLRIIATNTPHKELREKTMELIKAAQ